jgi:CDP-glucose 4,6-dehydratase
MTPEIWRGRRVFVTGHTGFKGGWLSLWLARLGATVTGFAHLPDTRPNLFTEAGVGNSVQSLIGDIRDQSVLRAALISSRAEVVFHCAAQSLVRRSYETPLDTFDTNVMGTAHVLEAVRSAGSVRAVVIVTSDKCYAEHEAGRAYVEGDRLGGRDPYSSSKACAELVTSAYRSSFFDVSGPPVVTARAGNVIGGGDWAPDRLVPDLVRAFSTGAPAMIRYPDAVRPWQHVLEPLQGYLLLAEAMLSQSAIPDSFNFAPSPEDTRPVSALVEAVVRRWGNGAAWRVSPGPHPREARALRLDGTRARQQLGWRPLLTLDTALEWTVDWYRAFEAASGSARKLTDEQIDRYQALLP